MPSRYTRTDACFTTRSTQSRLSGLNPPEPEREYIPVRHEWEEYYDIRFSDGGAEVTLFGFYEFRFMQIALFTALGLSFFIFFLIVMLGIRKSMRYIRLLGKEIGILEGGNLDYQVTIQGRDELADLAKGLDSMRQAFYNLLSETTSYLEQKGFSVQLELDWQPRYVSVNQDYISRIFDNLTSNLLKYADAGQTIQVKWNL